jgi:hypothetical protein
MGDMLEVTRDEGRTFQRAQHERAPDCAFYMAHGYCSADNALQVSRRASGQNRARQNRAFCTRTRFIPLL